MGDLRTFESMQYAERIAHKKYKKATKIPIQRINRLVNERQDEKERKWEKERKKSEMKRFPSRVFAQLTGVPAYC